MKILISGARSLSNNKTYTELEKVLNRMNPTTILHGGAKGVDTLAARYAKQKNLPQKVIKPDYAKGGKYAPLMRNTELVKQADKVICIYAADRIRQGGTGDTYKKAMKAGKLAAELIPEKGEVLTHLSLF